MKWLVKIVLMLCPMWMKGQITIDGVMNEPYWQIIGVANGNNGFGSQNNLGLLKYYSNATTLYVGITGILENFTQNNIVLFIDCDNYGGRGSNTLAGNSTSSLGVFNTSSTGSCPLNNGLAGSKMDVDFDLDYAIAFNKGFSNNDFFADGMRFGSGLSGYFQQQFIGQTGGINGQQFNNTVPNWLGTGNMKFSYQDGFDAVNFPNYGIEMEIPYTVMPGVNRTNRIRFFVLITDGNGFGSNECIPGDPVNNLGCSFDLSLNHNNPIADIFYTQPWQVLPLSFLGTSLKTENERALLQWSVVKDLEAVRYLVERSSDGIHFDQQAALPSQQKSDIAKYQYSDIRPLSGKSFYRIKAILATGQIKTSPILSLSRNPGRSIRIYPNPLREHISIQFKDVSPGPANIELFNAVGLSSFRQSFNLDGNDRNISFSLPALQKGLYMVKLTTSDGIHMSKVMVE